MTVSNKIIHIDQKRRMAAKLWLPENYNSGIVIAHSWRNNLNEPMCKDAAEYFYKKGIAALQICLPGHNEWEQMRELDIKSSTEYSAAAVNYLREETKATKITGLGISLGSLAIGCSDKGLYNAQILISYSPLISPEKGLSNYTDEIEQKRDFLTKHGFVILKSSTGRANFEMGANFIKEKELAEFPNIYFANQIPTLLVQGTLDSLYDQQAINEFANKSHATSLIVEGADHNITNPEHRQQILNKSYAFLQNVLK